MPLLAITSSLRFLEVNGSHSRDGGLGSAYFFDACSILFDGV